MKQIISATFGFRLGRIERGAKDKDIVFLAIVTVSEKQRVRLSG